MTTGLRWKPCSLLRSPWYHPSRIREGVLSPPSGCGGKGSPSDLHCTVGAGLISRGVQIKVLAPHLASPDTSLAGEGPPHYAQWGWKCRLPLSLCWWGQTIVSFGVWLDWSDIVYKFSVLLIYPFPGLLIRESRLFCGFIFLVCIRTGVLGCQLLQHLVRCSRQKGSPGNSLPSRLLVSGSLASLTFLSSSQSFHVCLHRISRGFSFT